MAAPSSRAFRRYPSLVYLALASALGLLLPTTLNVVQTGPSTLAEYAPVPGAGHGPSDLSTLEAASSGGFGAARGDQATARGRPPAARPRDLEASGRLVRRPGTKRCVGNPPRQTEDPLSPPCVAFFDGDNGGATARGVTADRVVVVMPSDGDKTTSRIVDCNEPPAAGDSPNDSLCKAYMRYFNERYQTYGRRVHLYSTLMEDADVDDRLTPFAWLGNGSATDYGALGVLFAGARRHVYASVAPLLIGYRPDLEDAAAIAASFVCSSLAGRPARFSGTPVDGDRTRSFGLVMQQGAYRDLFLSTLEQRCGVTIPPAATSANPTTDATAAARFRQAGVTTVLISADNSGAATVMSRQATSLGWFPEWVVPGEPAGRGLDRNSAARSIDQVQWVNAIALTFDVRRGPVTEQPWYVAYREGCGDCPEPRGFTTASFEYDMLSELFYGIQAAGPRLSPENIERGLTAIPPRQSTDPFAPAAYFTPGNHTFIKDAMVMWWDPTAQAPGSPNRGCYRLTEEGRRYRAGEWRAGDAHLRGEGPCQGDTIQ